MLSPIREFTSEAELKAHYAKIRARRLSERRPIALAFPPIPAPALTSWASVNWLTADEAAAYFDVAEARAAPAPRPEVPFPVILRRVSTFYGIPQNAIMSHRRQAKTCRARQIVMFLAYSLKTLSYPDIGRRLGGRDHTTIMHGVTKIGYLRQQDSKLNAELSQFERELAAA